MSRLQGLCLPSDAYLSDSFGHVEHSKWVHVYPVVTSKQRVEAFLEGLGLRRSCARTLNCQYVQLLSLQQ